MRVERVGRDRAVDVVVSADHLDRDASPEVVSIGRRRQIRWRVLARANEGPSTRAEMQ
jgi:hypothetical protein